MTRQNDSLVDDGDTTKAYQNYYLSTESDGSISGRCETNDNLDQGAPNEFAEWEVRFRNHQEMVSHTGLSHVGISGVAVTVYLDGERLERGARRLGMSR